MLRKNQVFFLLFFCFFIITILIFTGCGGTEGNGDVSKEPSFVIEQSNIFDQARLLRTREISDVIKHFSELKIEITSEEEGKIIHYKYLGREAVDEIKTHKIFIDINDTQMGDHSSEIWIDDEGSIRKADIKYDKSLPELPYYTQSEDEIPTHMMNVLLFNSYYASSFNLRTIEEEGTLLESRDETFGDLSGRVYTFDCPDIKVGKFLLGPGKVSIGDFGDFLGIVRYETKHRVSQLLYVGLQ